MFAWGRSADPVHSAAKNQARLNCAKFSGSPGSPDELTRTDGLQLLRKQPRRKNSDHNRPSNGSGKLPNHRFNKK
jgi:hypothetical protein